MASKKNAIPKERRERKSGSIYKRKDGLWTGVVELGFDEDGKRKRKFIYGKNKDVVTEKLSRMVGKMVNFGEIKEENFGSIMESWLMIFKKNAVSPRTFENGLRNYRLHIKPYIGQMDIEDITPTVIQRIYNEIYLKGLASNTARKVKHLLNQFFEFAIENNYTTSNPTLKTKVKSFDRKIYEDEDRYKAIPQDVRDKFLSSLNNHETLKPICMCAMFAGLRIGEVLALRWEDVDFQNKTIKVGRAITRLPIFDKNGKKQASKTVISDTKTACSVREVPIPDILINTLQDWKKVQWVKEQLGKAKLTDKKSLVFCYDDGKVRDYHALNRMLSRFLKTNKLDSYGIHFHTLRHTYSNMLFEMNENPKVIQSLLGHKSVKTTLSVYNSVDKSYYKQATDKLNKLFNDEKMKSYQVLEKRPNAPIFKKEELIPTEDEEIAILEKLLERKRQEAKSKKQLECE